MLTLEKKSSLQIIYDTSIKKDVDRLKSAKEKKTELNIAEKGKK